VTNWQPVGFDSFDDVPLHYRPLDKADREIQYVMNDREGLMYFYKPSTDQYWIQIGFNVDEHGVRSCPVDRCGAQCCREGPPWPAKFLPQISPCPFLADDKCSIQQAKFTCCTTAPEPWNHMSWIDKCEIRCVEVTRG